MKRKKIRNLEDQILNQTRQRVQGHCLRMYHFGLRFQMLVIQKSVSTISNLVLDIGKMGEIFFHGEWRASGRCVGIENWEWGLICTCSGGWFYVMNETKYQNQGSNQNQRLIEKISVSNSFWCAYDGLVSHVQQNNPLGYWIFLVDAEVDTHCKKASIAKLSTPRSRTLCVWTPPNSPKGEGWSWDIRFCMSNRWNLLINFAINRRRKNPAGNSAFLGFFDVHRGSINLINVLI